MPTPQPTDPRAVVEVLLRDREFRGIVWSNRARLAYISVGALLTLVGWASNGYELTAPTVTDLIVSEGLMAAGVFVCMVSLRWAQRGTHLTRAGMLGLSYDLTLLLILPISWYQTSGGFDAVPLSFFSKSELIFIALGVIGVNSLALRPLYPLVVTSAATLQQLAFFALALSDPRTELTQEPLPGLMGPAINVIVTTFRILSLMIVGGFMVALGRSARNTVRLAVELESENWSMRERQAELIAEGKMTALASLVAGIAHEINNPLGVLKSQVSTLDSAAGNVERAQRHPDGGGARLERSLDLLQAGTKTANAAINRMQGLVRSLKSFAQLDQARVQRFDVREGLETVLALIPEGTKQGVKTSRAFGEVPSIRANAQALNQVFMTIVRNAFEASAGRGEVEIRTAARDGMVEVSIRDTGPGLQADVVKSLFEIRFSTQQERVGVGLGLPIASRIIQQHGGTVAVESQPGQGTTFRILLPTAGHRAADTAV